MVDKDEAAQRKLAAHVREGKRPERHTSVEGAVHEVTSMYRRVEDIYYEWDGESLPEDTSRLQRLMLRDVLDRLIRDAGQLRQRMLTW